MEVEKDEFLELLEGKLGRWKSGNIYMLNVKSVFYQQESLKKCLLEALLG